MRASVLAIAAVTLLTSGCFRQRMESVAPNLSLEFLHRHNDEGTLEFVLRNPSSSTLWYDGYGATSPLFGLEFLEEDGWNSTSFGWCGTGVERQKLAAESDVHFVIGAPLDGARTFRVAVSVATNPGMKNARPVKSSPVQLARTPEEETR